MRPVAGVFLGDGLMARASGRVGLRSRDPSRWARAIAGEAPRLVADSRFGPGENSVRVVERPTIPPAIYWWAFSLRRRANAVERSVADWVAVIAEKLADLLSREAPLSVFHCDPLTLPEISGRVTKT
jgi:hypothetical protein